MPYPYPLSDDTLEAMHAITTTLVPIQQAIFAWAREALPRIEAVGQILAQTVHDAYEAAGMPYGDSDEGMLRWLREMSEARRLREQAELIEERHRALADFRQQLARHRE